MDGADVDQPGHAVGLTQLQQIAGSLHIDRPEGGGQLAGDVDDAGGVDDHGLCRIARFKEWAQGVGIPHVAGVIGDLLGCLIPGFPRQHQGPHRRAGAPEQAQDGGAQMSGSAGDDVLLCHRDTSNLAVVV